MRAFPALLHKFDPAVNPRAFPTPRTWEFVNDIYEAGLAPDDQYETIKGTIGDGAAGQFLAHVKNLHGMPTFEQIRMNPDTTKLPTNSSAQYAVCEMLHPLVSTNNIGPVMTYMNRMPVEYQALFMRAAIRRDEKLTGTKEYMAWGLKHQTMLM